MVASGALGISSLEGSATASPNHYGSPVGVLRNGIAVGLLVRFSILAVTALAF